MVLEQPRKTQCNQALDGTSLDSHREETAGFAPMICIGPSWWEDPPHHNWCRATGLHEPVSCLTRRTRPTHLWNLKCWKQKAGYLPEGHWHTSVSRTRHTHWAWNRENFPHEVLHQARAVWPLYLLVRKVNAQDSLSGQVGVGRWCDETACAHIYFKQLAHTAVRTGKSRICGAGSRLEMQEGFWVAVLRQKAFFFGKPLYS